MKSRATGVPGTHWRRGAYVWATAAVLCFFGAYIGGGNSVYFLIGGGLQGILALLYFALANREAREAAR